MNKIITALLLVLFVLLPATVAGQTHRKKTEPLPNNFMSDFYQAEALYASLPDKHTDVVNTNDPRCTRAGHTQREQLMLALQQLESIQNIVDTRPFVNTYTDEKIKAAIVYVKSHYPRNIAELQHRLERFPIEVGTICKIEKRAEDPAL